MTAKELIKTLIDIDTTTLSPLEALTEIMRLRREALNIQPEPAPAPSPDDDAPPADFRTELASRFNALPPRKFTLADARKPISDYDAVVSRVCSENGHKTRSHHHSEGTEGHR